MQVQQTVVGAPDLKANMKNLKKGMNTTALRRAIRAGGRVVQIQAAANAPVQAGKRRKIKFKNGNTKKKLSKSIRLSNVKNPKGQTGEVKVADGCKKDSYHGNFIHSGAKSARIAPLRLALKFPKSSGIESQFVRGTGVTIPRRSANPFLTKAFRQKRNAARRAIAFEMNKAQAKAARK